LHFAFRFTIGVKQSFGQYLRELILLGRFLLGRFGLGRFVLGRRLLGPVLREGVLLMRECVLRGRDGVALELGAGPAS
jgi:hypothetical protein